MVAIIAANHALQQFNECNTDVVQMALTGGCVDLYNSYLEASSLVQALCQFDAP